ncbi:GNAT family N-acetyltransferase [Allorhizocola rhizosphaerae]|uniref:GNAT family N-acetyltransferase n=1 Tax=Allorhizocola rhizosphaerae TaxID=1872709 RepID=UPI000E3D9460|nr:GNAT family N-acetyltransferase [Allorhizocola rhizosphaerae]
MTTVIGKDTARAELAALLEVDASALDDGASLRDGLALDSLTMMRLITWLEARGTPITAEAQLPATVGELLSHVEDAKHRPRLSIRLGGVPGLPERFTLAPPRDQLAPVLETPALRLAPLTPDDLGFLYALAVEPETGFRWRYRGSIPPIERFKAELWNQVLIQFVVRRIEDDLPVGHVVAYGDELSLRHTYLGAVFHPRITGGGLAAQAVALFARYLFRTFPLNKIYMEIPGINWPQLQSGQGRLFQVEGVLRDHDYYAGRLWDKYVCALYPGDVETSPATVAPAAGETPTR